MLTKLRNIILVLFVIFTYSSQSSAQTSDFKSKFGDADYFFLFEEYNKAIKIYLELYQMDKTNANINYLVGLCYIQSVKDKEKIKAIPFLEFASKNINPKYKEGKYKETKAPIYSLYYLAFAYRLNNEFEKAIESYRTYITYLKPKDKEEMHNALKEIESCYYAMKLIKVPVNLESIKIDQFADTMKQNDVAMLYRNADNSSKSDSLITSDAIDRSFLKATTSESCPIVSSDGSFMVFSMGENNQFPQEVNVLNFDFQFYKTDDIYYATKSADGQWNKPVNIIPQLKPKYQVVPVCLSPDGATLYLVEDDNDDGNIYQSKLENGMWTAMEKVKGDINTRQWETHASMADDRKTMYFTSARGGGFGGLDIYKSTLKENGEWGKAENLGAEINTAEDEETPSVLPDGKTLFFSSKGHKGIGGFDIFSSILGSDGKWSAPLNAGYSINTVNHDFVYINKVNNQLAYTPLNRTDLREDFSGKEDKNNSYILNVNNEKPTKPSFDIKGTVVFKVGSVKIPDKFSVCIIDSIRKDTVKNTVINENNGEYAFNITSGTYYINFKADGYKDYSHLLFLPEIYTPSGLTVNIELVPVNEKSDIVAQTDVIFDYEKNIPNLNKKRNINLSAFKNRDSLRLIAENNFKQRELSENVNRNMVGIDTTTKNDNQLIVENTNNKNQENKNQLTEKQNNQNAKNEQLSETKNTKDGKNNQGKQTDDKSTKTQQDNKNLTTENKQKQNDLAEKNNLTENKNNKNNDQSAGKNSIELSGSTVVKNVLFDFDCVKPKDFKDNLDKLANYLVNNKNCRIVIEGHSDNQGDDNYKQIISDMRADFLMKYLVSNGALKSNITTKGYSSSKLIASEYSPYTRRYNRRAEFKIVEACGNLIIEAVTIPDDSKLTNTVVTSSENSNAIRISNLFFNFDFLNPIENSELDKLVEYLKQNPACIIEIVGHSDDQGDASYKQFVSLQRANNVRKKLIQKGVNSVSLKTRGESDSKQISINISPDTRKYNRRVEFIVLKEGSQKLIIEPIVVPQAYRLK